MECKLTLQISPMYQADTSRIDLVVSYVDGEDEEYEVSLIETVMRVQEVDGGKALEPWALTTLRNAMNLIERYIAEDVARGQASLMDLAIKAQKHLG